MIVSINPEWDSAELELGFVDAQGSRIDIPHPVRFRKEDAAEVIAALGIRDSDAMNHLAIRKFKLYE